jgi:hypothetical protein
VWLAGFEGLSTREARLRLVAAMVAAGEPARAEAALAAALEPKFAECAQALLGLARVAPALAGKHLAPIVARAETLLNEAYYPLQFLEGLAGAATILGQHEVAARVEALGRDPEEKFVARLAVLLALAPGDAAWGSWFARARAELPESRDAAVRLAAAAHRAGLHEASGELLVAAIEAARASSSADLSLQEVSGQMADAGDLAGGHRAWLAISKGRRPSRNGSLIGACVAREQWAAVVDLLRQMPNDLNGAPSRALKILLTVAGGEGF